MPRRRMSRVSGRGRALEYWRLALVVVFVYGTAVHVLQLAGSGGSPYPGNPGWLRVYFVSLTVVDPVLAVGLWLRCRWAVWAALVVLATDSAANAWANYVVTSASGVTLGRIAQGVITVLVFAVAATARPLNRHFALSKSVEDPA